MAASKEVARLTSSVAMGGSCSRCPAELGGLTITAASGRASGVESSCRSGEPSVTAASEEVAWLGSSATMTRQSSRCPAELVGLMVVVASDKASGVESLLKSFLGCPAELREPSMAASEEVAWLGSSATMTRQSSRCTAELVGLMVVVASDKASGVEFSLKSFLGCPAELREPSMAASEEVAGLGSSATMTRPSSRCPAELGGGGGGADGHCGL